MGHMWQGMLGTTLRGRDLIEVGGSRIWRGPIEVVEAEEGDMVSFKRAWTAVSSDNGKSWRLCDSVPTSVSTTVAGFRSEGDDALIVMPGITLKIMAVGNNLSKPAS